MRPGMHMTQYKAQLRKPFYCPWAQLQRMEVYSLVMCFPLIHGKCDLQLWCDSCLKTLRKLLERSMSPLVWVDPFVFQLWTKAMAIACQWVCWCLRPLKPYCWVGLPLQLCCCGKHAPIGLQCPCRRLQWHPSSWRAHLQDVETMSPPCTYLYCYFHFPQFHLSIMI